MFNLRKKETLKKPTDTEFLDQQALLLAGQLRGVMNDRAREINAELLMSNFMELASIFYTQGWEDCQKEKALAKE